jgi:hypothetical protein
MDEKGINCLIEETQIRTPKSQVSVAVSNGNSFKIYYVTAVTI